MPARRLKKNQAHLEITAFINLIVVLVPFLLSVSVFTHLAVIDLAHSRLFIDKLGQLKHRQRLLQLRRFHRDQQRSTNVPLEPRTYCGRGPFLSK